MSKNKKPIINSRPKTQESRYKVGNIHMQSFRDAKDGQIPVEPSIHAQVQLSVYPLYYRLHWILTRQGL